MREGYERRDGIVVSSRTWNKSQKPVNQDRCGLLGGYWWRQSFKRTEPDKSPRRKSQNFWLIWKIWVSKVPWFTFIVSEFSFPLATVLSLGELYIYTFFAAMGRTLESNFLCYYVKKEKWFLAKWEIVGEHNSDLEIQICEHQVVPWCFRVWGSVLKRNICLRGKSYLECLGIHLCVYSYISSMA